MCEEEPQKVLVSSGHYKIYQLFNNARLRAKSLLRQFNMETKIRTDAKLKWTCN